MATLYRGQDFEFNARLDHKNKPLRINDEATVRAAITDNNGNLLTGWTTYNKDQGDGSDWQLGLIYESIPIAEVDLIASGVSSGQLRINIQGSDEDRDGVVSSNTYDRSWDFGVTFK